MDAVAIGSILSVIACVIILGYLIIKVVKLINTDKPDE